MRSKIHIAFTLIICLIGFSSCDSDDDAPTAPTAEQLLLNKNWTDDFGGSLRFNSNGVFIDTGFSGVWSWEESDEEPYIIKADYEDLFVWFEFTEVTDTSLIFRISSTGPPQEYNFEGSIPLTTD
jgi:hypothetical protein